jgi:uncharacterized protein (DUF433 family)
MQAALGSYIDAHPDKCGGKPCIAGTRIRVQDVYVWHELRGQSPDEIVAAFPHLSLAQVHAALAYYHDHRDEIQVAVNSERTWAEEMKSTHPSKLLQKLMGTDGANPVSS